MIFQLEIQEQITESEKITLLCHDEFKFFYAGVETALEMHKEQGYELTVSVWDGGKVISSYVYETFDGSMSRNSGNTMYESMVQTLQAFRNNTSK